MKSNWFEFKGVGGVHQKMSLRFFYVNGRNCPFTHLLSDRFHLGLFSFSGFLDVLWCQSGNHRVMDRPALTAAPAGPVEEASTLSRPARPCRWGNTYGIECKNI